MFVIKGMMLVKGLAGSPNGGKCFITENSLAPGGRSFYFAYLRVSL